MQRLSRLPGLPLWRLWRWRLLRFLGSLPLVLGRRAVYRFDESKLSWPGSTKSTRPIFVILFGRDILGRVFG